MSIKHTLFISALTVSAAFTLAATGQFGNNQQSYNHLTTPITVQARRRHRRYRVHFRKIRHRRRHTTRRARRHGHSHFVVHFRRITPKRHYRAHRVHHYHIDVEGVDGGWTTNYHYYKSESAKIQHAIDVQTAKDEEAEGINPNQVNNDQDQTDSNSASNDNNQDNQQTTQPKTDNNDFSENTDNSSSNSVQNNINEMNSETLADINQDREENGEQPYQESQALDQVANMRAQQYAEDPNADNPHIDPNTGNYYSDEDAAQLGLSNTQLGENVDDQGLGTEETYYNTYVKNHNGTDMADEANDEMVNHDSFCGNGHRNNILNPTTHYVGVGTAYNKDTDSYYLAEDFSY